MAHERYTIAASRTLAPGPTVVRVDVKSDGGIGKGATVTLSVNGTKMAEGRLDKTVVARFGNETFDVGMDEGSPVSEAYGPPFAFPGTIRKIQIQLSPSRLSARDQQQIRNASGQLAMGIQ
jgi:arylsulfatase